MLDPKICVEYDSRENKYKIYDDNNDEDASSFEKPDAVRRMPTVHRRWMIFNVRIAHLCVK